MSATHVARPPIASPLAGWTTWKAILLVLPALLPLLNACVLPYLQHRIPTGFIQYDMPYYLANGRAHFNNGFHLTYSNPYAGYNAPAIYFQPQTLLLGLMQQVGLTPGLALNLFGVFALGLVAVVAARFYAEAIGIETTAKKIGLLCLFWGGGVFTLAGLAYGLAHGHPFASPMKFDPVGGWWLLNFGRNLVYPLEAYYHAIFLLSLLALIRRRLVLSLAFAVLLSMSHPFTGLALVLVLIAYSAIELLRRSGNVSLSFLLCAILLAGLHVGYYLIWLGRFDEHRLVQSQWLEPWLYPPKTFVPGLLLVGGLAIWRIAKSSFHCFQDARVRLFAVWFVVVFALTQHNLVVRPFQPIHFARGYDWMALFFIGAPALIAFFEFLLRMPAVWIRRSALTLVLSVFLLDNAVWLAKNGAKNNSQVSLSKPQSDTLSWLSDNVTAGDMVISQDTLVGYLVSTYTPARSWLGHAWNTPLREQRRGEIDRFFAQGRISPDWQRKGVFYVSPAAWSPPQNFALERRYRNSDFSIWVSPPTGTAP